MLWPKKHTGVEIVDLVWMDAYVDGPSQPTHGAQPQTDKEVDPLPVSLVNPLPHMALSLRLIKRWILQMRLCSQMNLCCSLKIVKLLKRF